MSLPTRTVNCALWSACDSRDGGCCANPDVKSNRPSFGVCRACTHRQPISPDAPPVMPVNPRPAAKPEPAPAHGPGSILKLAIKSITGETPGSSCACNKRAKLMDSWGWWGCWKRRDEIAGWLAEEAKKRGHPIEDHAAALSLLKAAWRESRR